MVRARWNEGRGGEGRYTWPASSICHCGHECDGAICAATFFRHMTTTDREGRRADGESDAEIVTVSIMAGVGRVEGGREDKRVCVRCQRSSESELFFCTKRNARETGEACENRNGLGSATPARVCGMRGVRCIRNTTCSVWIR